MAARRLVVLMLVLLFLTSLATALAPVDRTPEGDPPVAQEEEDVASPGPPTRLVRAAIGARERQPSVVVARVGDQLQLRVGSRRVATIELVRLGATDDAAPRVPAVFDLFLDAEGSYPIRELETRRRIGVLEVGPAARVSPDPARSERGPAPARARP